MKDERDFEDSYRAWAARPSALSAQDVADRLDGQRPRRSAPQMAWLMTVLLAASAGGGAWWVLRERPRALVNISEQAPMGRPLATESDDVVVVWVDEQTPVQVFLTEASARGTR